MVDSFSGVENGRSRVVIEGVKPEIDCGRFPIKRTIGEKVVVEADVFTDGHDVISCVLLYRKQGVESWKEVPMTPLVNDRWRGEFDVTELGRYRYSIQAWVDRFKSWSRDLAKRVEAEQVAEVDLLIGADMIDEARQRAASDDAARLETYAQALRSGGSEAAFQALSSELADLMARYSERRFATTYQKELAVAVDRKRARFSTWYEMFPRSCSSEPGAHGTFADCEARLPYIAGMGFNVLYLPPIHPIGRAHRKGPNNTIPAAPEDLGSPWAIGAEEGGHKAVHPQLGSLEDFRSLVQRASEYKIEIAMDLAYQVAPDHPYPTQHSQWFRRRPDGTIQYAENPPKKYQDIYPFDFESEGWSEMWEELKSIVLFWIDQGVRIFRVDNPHTKPFPFWEWLITEIKKEHPDVIFLAEAFTRPKVMYRLAKLGFTQSYTYFAWRNNSYEIRQYFEELTQTEVHEYFRPNLWPNTPDILTEYLQWGGRAAFMIRLVLAATLGASYGIYGPAFELHENRAREAGSEEYLDSEKYQIRNWDIARSDSLRDFIARINRIRRENKALHSDGSLRFHAATNDQIICYSKHTEDLTNVVLAVVGLDPHHTHSGWIDLPLEVLGLDAAQQFQVHDLLSEARYIWQGPRNYVELNPNVTPAHIFIIRKRVRTETDFTYYM